LTALATFSRNTVPAPPRSTETAGSLPPGVLNPPWAMAAPVKRITTVLFGGSPRRAPRRNFRPGAQRRASAGTASPRHVLVAVPVNVIDLLHQNEICSRSSPRDRVGDRQIGWVRGTGGVISGGTPTVANCRPWPILNPTHGRPLCLPSDRYPTRETNEPTEERAAGGALERQSGVGWCRRTGTCSSARNRRDRDWWLCANQYAEAWEQRMQVDPGNMGARSVAPS